MHASWLTWKMHRFEIGLTVVLVLVLGVSAAIAASQLQDALVPRECWGSSGSDQDLRCDRLVRSYFGAADQAGLVMGMMALVPVFVGLALGVPIVAREIETHTASLAWSLRGSRSRWLTSRAMPMVVPLVVGLGLLGWVTADLSDVQAQAYDVGHSLNDLGNQGLPLAGRGFMALGIGLLIGSVAGRTLPALLLGGLVMALWFGFGAPAIRSTQLEDHFVWMTYDDRDANQVGGLAYDQPDGLNWYRTADGTFVSERKLMVDACGDIPPKVLDAMSRYEEWERADLTSEQLRCIDDMQETELGALATRLVPDSAFGDFERTETLVTAGIGLIAMLLTFPVVARRRPG